MNTQAVRNKVDVQQIRLLLVDTCNAKCKGCHNEGQDISGKVMDLEWIEKFISQISGLNVGEIILSGGEPLLHPHLENIIKTVRENLNCSISINTNGSVGNKLVKIYPLVDEVKLHIESSDKEEYEELMKLDFIKIQDVLEQLPDYSKIVFSSILRSKEQALGLIQFSNKYEGSELKFNELTEEPQLSIAELEDILVNEEGYFVAKRQYKKVTLMHSYGPTVYLRTCEGNSPFIDANKHLRRDLNGVSIDLTPVVDKKSTEELTFLLSSVEEVEYRWCVSQPAFSSIGSVLGLQQSYQYQMDRVYVFDNTENTYFRIKDRGGVLTFDIKGRGSDTEMFREQTVNLSSLTEALEFAEKNTHPSISIEKFRASCHIGNCELSLDKVSELGYFIEIEGPDAKLVATKIGLDPSQQAKAYGYYIENGIIPVPIELDITELNLNKGI